jgi:hypothetical protein
MAIAHDGGARRDFAGNPEHVRLLAARVEQRGLQLDARMGSWAHMGAVIVDAALQPGMSYSTVAARARKIRDVWPDAVTLSGFRSRLAAEDIGQVLPWRGSKVDVMHGLVEFFTSEGIETVGDIKERYDDPSSEAAFMQGLHRIKGVKRKTSDYLAMLSGSDQHVAIDSRLRGFAAAAGVPALSYDALRAVIVAAARELGCTPGALDWAIWQAS